MIKESPWQFGWLLRLHNNNKKSTNKNPQTITSLVPKTFGITRSIHNTSFV